MINSDHMTHVVVLPLL